MAVVFFFFSFLVSTPSRKKYFFPALIADFLRCMSFLAAEPFHDFALHFGKAALASDN